MANTGYLPPYSQQKTPCTVDGCGGLPNPEQTDKLASGLKAWDAAVLDQTITERNDLREKLIAANRQIERAQNALRKIALGHPCDLHDLIAKDAMRDMKFIAAGQTPPPATPRNGGVCELNGA